MEATKARKYGSPIADEIDFQFTIFNLLFVLRLPRSFDVAHDKYACSWQALRRAPSTLLRTSSLAQGRRVRALYIFLAVSKSSGVRLRLSRILLAERVEMISPLGSLAERKCAMKITAPGKLKSLSSKGV